MVTLRFVLDVGFVLIFGHENKVWKCAVLDLQRFLT